MPELGKCAAIRDAIRPRQLILSGGLTPENVKGAVARVRPYAVDVSSGVELSPGRKDINKMQSFVRNAREADGPE